MDAVDMDPVPQSATGHEPLNVYVVFLNRPYSTTAPVDFVGRPSPS
jgi:hypothetical protein